MGEVGVVEDPEAHHPIAVLNAANLGIRDGNARCGDPKMDRCLQATGIPDQAHPHTSKQDHPSRPCMQQ